ncbi:MAG: Fe-S cluster assembly protein SufB [Nanoarchaeota archaeon]
MESGLSFRAAPGISETLVREISLQKREPEWMLQKRLHGLKLFHELPLPAWGPSLKDLDLSTISMFLRPDAKKNATNWEDVPRGIKDTFERLGIPEAERKVLSGVGAQFESEVIYHKLKEEWKKRGVIFLDCDEAVQRHPDLIKTYFMTTCIPPGAHKFAALHAAVWSGGTFIYIPKGVKVKMPLQAYFRMNSRAAGQFEHTLINIPHRAKVKRPRHASFRMTSSAAGPFEHTLLIVDEGAEVHYIEGCSAPQYREHSLHAGCVEIHVLKGARARYSSIENWSKNTFNLNSKRAIVHDDGIMEWVNGNMGSKTTMLYPASVLLGDRARSDYLGIAFAGEGQNQDTGTKAILIGKGTSAVIRAKSISKDGGITSYRGQISIKKGAVGAKVSASCDALMMDARSSSNTYPLVSSEEHTAELAHEATVGKISEEHLFYLMSRGLSEQAARQMIVSGFIEPIVKELPLEYAVELNRLIQLEMEGLG